AALATEGRAWTGPPGPTPEGAEMMASR
ncbi:MAG: hypothetical protein ACI9ZH_001658, partial [Paracoccaceae bacterium]